MADKKKKANEQDVFDTKIFFNKIVQKSKRNEANKY